MTIMLCRSRPGPFRGRLAAFGALALIFGACTTTAEPEFSSLLEAPSGDSASGGADPQPDPECDPDNPTASYDPQTLLASENPETEDDVLDLSTISGSSLDTIRERGTLRAGVGADGLLFGFLDPNSGQLGGFDVAMAELVAGALFGGDGADHVDLIPIRSAERIERLRNGDVDIVVKTMTITCARWGQIDFSATYFDAGQRLLVRADSEIEGIDDLTTERICAIPGTTSIARLEEQGVETVEADTWTGCLVKVQLGQAEGVSTDDTILAGLAAQDPLLRVVGEPFSAEPYGIGVADENEDLTRFVNAALEQAKADGTWAEIYNRWLERTLGPAPNPPDAQYRDR